MEVLREQRRSTIDIEEKNSIRNQMLEAKVDHQNEVKALLNPDQQKQFDMIKAGGGQHKYMQTGNRQGNGNRGNGVRQGRGNGNRGNGFSQGNRNGNYNQCARNVRGNGNRGRGNVVNNCRSSRRGNQNFNY
jgi:hypothetical protein